MFWARIAAAAVALYFLYIFGLAGTGLIGPDEPRYASIGREMAASGDWITPRLWGEPWFEKPALIYWMTGAGFKLGLGPETAPRLPVALLSGAFLIFYWWALRRIFSPDVALYSTLVLATSGGWLAFSHAAVTDLPLAATFSAAMLVLLLPHRFALISAGALLGLAVLAKGLVPLVLILPVAWFERRRWREAWLPALACLAVAAPWYLACYFRHGRAFLDEFLWKHHLGRFASEELLHVQPFWFYVPVLAAALFPWSAGLGLLFRNGAHRRMLLWVVLFGFVFFSLSANKLPGYLLPLVPAACVLIGAGLAETRRLWWFFGVSGLLLGFLPVIASVLPRALGSGLSRAGWQTAPWLWTLMGIPLAGLLLWLEKGGRRKLAVVTLAAVVVAATVKMKVRVFPLIDQFATARPVYREAVAMGRACAPPLNRAFRYGLNYYSERPWPDCDQE